MDHRTDIFSMGIILYEMVTGQRPFRGDSTTSMLSSILRDTPTSVTELNPDVPRDLGRIIKRCLAKDSSRRYQNALDLRNELEELKADVVSGEAVVGGAPFPMKPAWWPKTLWVAGAVIALLAVAWIAGIIQLRNHPTSRSFDSPIPFRSRPLSAWKTIPPGRLMDGLSLMNRTRAATGTSG